MCLAVPAQLITVNDAIGIRRITGATRDCSLPSYQMQRSGTGLLVHARVLLYKLLMKKRHKNIRGL